MLVLFACVLGTIYSGIATVTEASSFGALGGFGVALYYRKLTKRTFTIALQRAIHASCMILMILIGASIFGYFFTLTEITQSIVAWVGALSISRWLIVAIILVGYVILGTFMDQIAILVLTIPVVLPVVVSLGFDPIWFGVIKIVTAEVGMITPPIGLNCFVVSRYSGQPIEDVFRGTYPHFVAHIIIITILVAFPPLVLWLPEHFQ
jgi:tripartite ATP-independent transporter DctM subunit